MQQVNMYEQPFSASEIGPVPLTIRVISMPRRVESMGGVMSSGQKTNTYVLYDVLPDELKARVKLAIDALQAQF